MNKPTIYATSDLHGMLPDPDSIPECDIFIVAGDVTPYHKYNRVFQEGWLHTHFAQWIGAVRARHKIWVAGNHDFVCQDRPEAALSHLWTYLRDQEITVEGLRIYATPWTPTFGRWAFMLPEEGLETVYAEIPQGIDVLISHGPPLRYCDRNIYGHHCGSDALLRRIIEVQPKAVVCGHIHEAYGLGRVNGTDIWNVSQVNYSYQPVNPPVQILLS